MEIFSRTNVKDNLLKVKFWFKTRGLVKLRHVLRAVQHAHKPHCTFGVIEAVAGLIIFWHSTNDPK